MSAAIDATAAPAQAGATSSAGSASRGAHAAALDFAAGIEAAVGEVPAGVHRPALTLAPLRMLLRLTQGVAARWPWGASRPRR